MLRIGITGGIGSGKTTVSKMFAVLGVPVFNSDECAKKIVCNTNIKTQIIQLLGKDSYTANGSYNRAYVGAKVFSNYSILEKLNAIIHPQVAKDFETFCVKNKHKPYIIKESALLFETNIYLQLYATILVKANQKTRIQRVMQRDGLTQQQVIQRIRNQMPQDQKIKLASYTIANNNDDLVIKQIVTLHNKILKF
jgi:dephospho-CoA kinase